MALRKQVHDLERSRTIQGCVLIATASGLLLLIATLYRKGVLKPGDIYETVKDSLADG